MENDSYHEVGEVPSIEAKQGHIVVEKGAEVAQIIVSEATAAVKVTANEATTVIADSASSAKTSVIANAEDVNVAGVAVENVSGDKSSKVVMASVVSSVEELDSAITAAKSFIQLGADITLSASTWKEFHFDFTLDLNGKTITDCKFDIYGKTVFTDSVGGGTILTSSFCAWNNAGAEMIVNGGTFKNKEVVSNYCCFLNAGKAIFNGGEIFNSGNAIYANPLSETVVNNVNIHDATYGIVCMGNGNSGSNNVTVNGGTISATGFAISGNGSTGKGGTVINVNGGKLLSTGDAAIYHPQSGLLNINGNPVLSGKSALYIKSGTVSITGGKFIAILSEKVNYNFNGNGANATGDAIVVDACNYPGGNPCVEASIDNASFQLADPTAKNVAYYSHEGGAAVVRVNGETLEPVIG